MAEQAATLNEAGGQIAYRFHARDLNLVMGPADAGHPGAIPGAHRRAAAGRGAREPTLTTRATARSTEQRLHQLIRQPGPIADRTFEITFLDPGAQAYSFTFG